MGKIVLLDDLTINQIAAGEVIERPASVVKELVENSIDAGAKNITVEIKNGGISYIRVTDDGSGILPDDMEIAFERHATSKIRSSKDLDTVKSMGFRGEALASIAAIADVEMISKTKDSDNGYKIEVKGGDLIEKGETGATKGTSIVVKELFYNTPVRYKFLKKDFTESGYIEDSITRIALANPNIAIKLISSGKTVIQTSGNGKLEDVIYVVFGKEILDNILPVDYIYDDMHITGVIGKPIISRSNRSNQLFFINKRFVKDKTLTSAAEQGFKGLMMIGKHGFLVLNIEMDANKVDVNVHPTKLEVRFQEESNVFKAVYHAIKETLLKCDLVSNPVKDYTEETPNSILKDIKTKDRVEAWNINTTNGIESSEVNTKNNEDKGTTEKENKDFEFFENIKNVIKGIKNNDKEKVEEIKPAIEKDESKEETAKIEETNEVQKEETLEQNNKDSFEEMYKKIFGRELSEAQKEHAEKVKEEEAKYDVMKPISKNETSLFEKVEHNKALDYNYVGIAFKTYIILTKGEELYLLDQHAAHERIMFDKVRANYNSKDSKDCQLMLMPDVMNLTTKEMGIFKDNKEMFNKAGFEVEEFGENTVKLTGVPEFCLNFNTKEIFLETLDEMDTVARTAKQELENKFLATVACKAAVKAHMALNKEEVDSLLTQLLKLPDPFSCPHGRPTIIKMTKDDIEKKFHRK